MVEPRKRLAHVSPADMKDFAELPLRWKFVACLELSRDDLRLDVAEHPDTPSKRVICLLSLKPFHRNAPKLVNHFWLTR